MSRRSGQDTGAGKFPRGLGKTRVGGGGRKFQSLGRLWDYRKDPEFLAGGISRKAPEGLQRTQTLEKVPESQAGHGGAGVEGCGGKMSQTV